MHARQTDEEIVDELRKWILNNIKYGIAAEIGPEAKVAYRSLNEDANWQTHLQNVLTIGKAALERGGGEIVESGLTKAALAGNLVSASELMSRGLQETRDAAPDEATEEWIDFWSKWMAVLDEYYACAERCRDSDVPEEDMKEMHERLQSRKRATEAMEETVEKIMDRWHAASAHGLLHAEVPQDQSRPTIGFPFPHVPPADSDAQMSIQSLINFWNSRARKSDEAERLQCQERPTTLCHVDEAIRLGIAHVGYPRKSYYPIPREVPSGFALVTHVEQIDAQGCPLEQHRFLELPPYKIHSIYDYFAALFTAHPGYYRIVVFLVTDQPYEQDGDPISKGGFEKLVESGASSLELVRNEVSKQRVTERHRCDVLIYEFKKPDVGVAPVDADLGLPARRHLRTIKMLEFLLP
jgi:hypothetical protein